jgi:hypothetical protein
MRLIARSFPILKANDGLFVKRQHTGARLPVHLQDVLDRVELTNTDLLGIMTDNTSSLHLMTRKLQSTPETSGIEWPALRNHIMYMAHVIQLALGAYMSSLAVQNPN